MLLIAPPTKRSNDVAISLRAAPGCDATADEMEDIALGSSCPPDIAARVRACIFHSGRYDCRISASAAFYLAYNPKQLDACGGVIILTEMP